MLVAMGISMPVFPGAAHLIQSHFVSGIGYWGTLKIMPR